MNCPEIKKKISSYIDRRLSGSETRDFETHIASCAACRERLEETRQSKAFLKSAAPPALPAGFMQRLNARLDSEVERSPAPRSRPPFGFSLRAVAGIAALFLCVIIAQNTWHSTVRRNVVSKTVSRETAAFRGRSDVKNDALSAQSPGISNRVPQIASGGSLFQERLQAKQAPMALSGVNQYTGTAALDKDSSIEKPGRVVSRRVEAVGESAPPMEPLKKKAEKAQERAGSVRRYLTIVAGWSGSHSGISEPLKTVIRDRKSWETLWARHSRAATGAPFVDFSRSMIVVVFMGEQGSGGYTVSIQQVISGNPVTVVYSEVTPAAGAIVTESLTQPFHMAVVGRIEAPVIFEATAKAYPSKE